jgi:hypothetical protein
MISNSLLKGFDIKTTKKTLAANLFSEQAEKRLAARFARQQLFLMPSLNHGRL